MFFVIQAFILDEELNVVDLLVIFYVPVLLSADTYWANFCGQRGRKTPFVPSSNWSRGLWMCFITAGRTEIAEA